MFSKPLLISIIKNYPYIPFHLLARKMNVNARENKNFSIFINNLKRTGLIGFSKKNNGFYLPVFMGDFEVDLKIRNDYGFASFVLNEEEKRAIVLW